jgi:surface antigen
MNTYFKILILAFVLLTPMACTDKIDIVESHTELPLQNKLVDYNLSVSAQINSTVETTYSPSPTINNWTVGTVGSVLNLKCAKYYTGLKAKVIAQNGNKFTVQLQRNDGKPFNGTGIGYIKAIDLCGNIAGSTNLVDKNHYYLNIDFWANFQSGKVAFQPTITINNLRYFANPITITAQSVSTTFPITTMKNSNNFSSGNIYCSSPTNVFAPANVGQCTWYVYGRVQELVASGYISQNNGSLLRSAFLGKTGRDAVKWPNFIGGTWYNASLDVSKRKKGMIVMWDNVVYNSVKTGHVGFVEEVMINKATELANLTFQH